MSTFSIIFIIIGCIKAVIFIMKNNKNPNENNRVISEYDFANNTEKHHKIPVPEIPVPNKIDPFVALSHLFPAAFDTDEEYSNKRITVVGNDIFITNDIKLRNREIEIYHVLKLEKDSPEINVFEDGGLIRTFVIEPKNSNPHLEGQFMHSAIKINANSSVQIDGYITKDSTGCETTDEGVRFQPFFLSDRDEKNKELIGKGMFERGLHYSGYITPRNIRLICICDQCKKSFNVEFSHAGFSEVQYFYSSNSKETLIVPYDNNLINVPTQLQKEINIDELKEIENKLPKSGDGKFEYYNSFKCPHCGDDYINFRANKEMRSYEYYLNFYINQKPLSLSRKSHDLQ